MIDSSVSDGLQKVGLTQPRTPVDEQRIVAVSWILGYSLSGGAGELVAVTDNKGIKRIPGIEQWQTGLLGGGRFTPAAYSGRLAGVAVLYQKADRDFSVSNVGQHFFN